MNAPEELKSDLKTKPVRPNPTEEQKARREAETITLKSNLADQRIKMIQDRMERSAKRQEEKNLRLTTELKKYEDKKVKIEASASSEAVKVKLTAMKERQSKTLFTTPSVAALTRRNLLKSVNKTKK